MQRRYLTHPFPSLAVVCIFCLLASACGRKAMPKPTQPSPPPHVEDLQAVVYPGMVETSWTLPKIEAPDKGDGPYTYSVQKSVIEWEDRNCPSCPPISSRDVQLVDPAHPAPSVAVKDGKASWTDSDVSVGAAYRYQISALDGKGRVVSQSPPAFVKILAAPPEPRDVKTKTGRDGVVLVWKDGRLPKKTKEPRGELQYLLERRPEGGEAWESVSPAPISGETFTDSATAPGQYYDYRLIPLMTADGASVRGNPYVVGHVQAPEEAPPSPPGSVWIIPAQGVMEVNWTESGGKVHGYHVYRREGKEIVRLTAEPVVRPPFVDHTAKPNAVYSYAISSVGPAPANREGLLSKWVEVRNVVFQ